MTVVSGFTALLSGASIHGTAGKGAFYTFSFLESVPDHYVGRFSEAALLSFTPFTAADRDAARQALDAWASVSGLTFFEVPAGDGDILFGIYNMQAMGFGNFAGYAYYPVAKSDWPLASDIFFRHDRASDPRLLLHEIGHALGLKHPHEGEPTLDPKFDDPAHTVMSYDNWAIGHSLGTLDVEAVRYLYGNAGADGTQVTSWSWDPATYTLSQTGADGAETILGIGTADLILGMGGNDYIQGRAGDDRLDGGDGDDQIHGGRGNDHLIGGAGQDTLEGDDANDINAGGNDRLEGGDGDDALGGGKGDDVLIGGGGDDVLAGRDGADVLEGGAGADTLTGGAGGDRFVYTATGDSGPGAQEHIQGFETGVDKIDLSALGPAKVSWTQVAQPGSTSLASQVTVTTGSGTLTILVGGPVAEADFVVAAGPPGPIVGTGGDDVLHGTDGADVIRGEAGNDFIDGGPGADEMHGGEGFDVYVVDDSGDRAIEVSSYGLDEVRTALASYVLPGDVEHLTGTSSAGQALTGNAGANLVRGGGGNDVIEGGGGPDALWGGAGDDVITDAAGPTAAHGEAGNDRIAIAQAAAAAPGDTYTLTGGEGDDEISVSLGGDAGVAVDGGAGDDRIVLAALAAEAQANVTLGAGRDTLVIGSEPAGYGLADVIVTDFAAGDAGDRIDLGAFLAGRLTGWSAGANPFATGHLGLVQAGPDAVIKIDFDGGGDAFEDLVRLSNVEESTLTEANLGFAVPRTDGTAGDDRLSGTAADETFRLEQGGDDQALGRDGGDVFYFGGAFGSADRVDGGGGSDEIVLQGDYFPPGQATLIHVADVERLTLLSAADVRFVGAGAGPARYNIALPDTFVFSGGALTVDGSGLGASEMLIFSGAVASGGALLLRGGAADDTLLGSAGDDVIEGNGGNDHLNGFGGADLMRGGAGDDDYYVDQAGDLVEEAPGQGTDTVHASLAAYALAANVERLYGNRQAGQALTGNALDNLIHGTDGNDLIDGGAGADEMQGGRGDDVYQVDGAADRVLDLEGVDEIRTHLPTYALGDISGIERLTGTAASGQALTGNGLANAIAGGAGSDAIDGGAGADAMRGGAGDDLYLVDNAGDTVVENVGEGTDEVRTALASFALAANVERLTGTGSGQVLTGNGLGNVIRAGDGADTLYGEGGDDALHGGGGDDAFNAGAGDDHIDGGAGADAMGGFAGNDVYLVDDAGDRAIEAAGDGTDEVRTGLASYALAANVENLTGISASGQVLTGNGADNVIIGGMGDDVIHGGAGDDILVGFGGFDTLRGAAGNDVYVIDAGDTVIEVVGDGIDEIRTIGAIYALAAGLENLRAASDINHDFRGNDVANVIVGGEGNDVLRLHDGGGDLAFGKGGVDSFYYGAAFDSGDYVDGGDNRDSLILQGDYAALTFVWAITGKSSLANIEGISLLSGTNPIYGDTSGRLYSYDLILVDGNIAAGALMKVNGFFLQAGESFSLDASAETDAPLQLLAGLGRDTLIGGGQGDAFVFGHDGRFGPGDSVDGGGGFDVVYLRGDYNIDFNQAGYAGSLSGIESIGLLTSANTEFAGGGDGEFDYAIVWNDAMLASGATLSVNGSRLQAHESFVFDGSQETDANLRAFGGGAADTLATGAGADQLHGGGGGDALTGGAGADLYRYSATSDSTASAFDTIFGFVPGQDRIDLGRIDAKAAAGDVDDAFAFIGAAAFSGTAGELRAVDMGGGLWRIAADVDGDAAADLFIEVNVATGQMLGAADFLL